MLCFPGGEAPQSGAALPSDWGLSQGGGCQDPPSGHVAPLLRQAGHVKMSVGCACPGESKRAEKEKGWGVHPFLRVQGFSFLLLPLPGPLSSWEQSIGKQPRSNLPPSRKRQGRQKMAFGNLGFPNKHGRGNSVFWQQGGNLVSVWGWGARCIRS